MFIGYSDVSKAKLVDKLRDAIAECHRNHGCMPIEIQVNKDDRGDLIAVDGIPITTEGKLVANVNMFWLKLPIAE
jgi:hypothetical protein